MLYRSRYRAGIPWRDLPARVGDRKNVHRRLRRWCESGVTERISGIWPPVTTTNI
ncbi:transposase [Acetobacter sp. LMG 1636]|uniref:Transposase n=1 Tax=Acetobacter fallax TaxID=1737473 RepID=A0ABX0KDA4_9PROT|nr:transposase [Acetobacter fallax]NHO37515.1 transposase [Acetobacter fallax]